MKLFSIVENVFLLLVIGFCLYVIIPEMGETLRGYGKSPDTKAWVSMIAVEFCGQELLSNYNRWKIKNKL